MFESGRRKTKTNKQKNVITLKSIKNKNRNEQKKDSGIHTVIYGDV